MPTYNSRGLPLYSTGETFPGWASAFNSQSNLLATALDDSDDALQAGASVATVGDLPVVGNWVGRHIYVVEDATVRVWNGSGWPVMSLAPVEYTPVWTTLGTPPSLGDSTLTGSYVLQGGQVSGGIQFTVGNTGVSGGTGTWRFSLPFTASRMSAAAGIVYNYGVGRGPISAEIDEGTAFLGNIVTAVQTMENLPLNGNSTIRLNFCYDI